MQTPLSLIFKRSCQLAFAMSLSRLLNTISTFVGILMIGRLSIDSLAASALITSTQITFIVIAMSFLFSIGIMSGHSFGAKKFEHVGRILQQGLVIATITAIPVMIVLSQIKPLLIFFGQNAAIATMDQSYFSIYLFLVLPLLWLVSIQQALLAIEKQQFVLLMSVIGLVLSAGLGYLFIYGWKIIPAMGIPGLGLAYAIQIFICLIIYIFYCRLNPSLKEYHLLRWHAGKHSDLLKQLLRIGWPIALQTASDLASFSFVTLMVGWLGITALAAQQISMQYFILLAIPIFAISQSSAILIGQARGAKDIYSVKQYGNMSLVIGLGFSLLLIALFLIFPHQLVNLYEGSSSNPNSTLEQLAVTILMLTGLRLFFDAAAEIYTGSLRGLYDTKIPMVILVITTWLIGIPLAYFFAFTLHWGLIGMTNAGILVMILNAAILYLRWRHQCQKLLLVQ